MNVLEEGVLLLCCRLGDQDAKPLTMPQYRELGLRVVSSLMGGNHLTELRVSDLEKLGYNKEQAGRILSLLDRQEQLQRYLAKGEEMGIFPITRISDTYPAAFVKKQASSRPPVLFAKGDVSLINRPGIAVIGSRSLDTENEAFARTVGRLIAEEGYVLISGGAAGADTAAQNACLEAGGSCVIFVPNQLDQYPAHAQIVYISEDGYDLPFSAARALHRNGLIHMQAQKTIAVQCTYGKGGTWNGCIENLKRGWSDLFVYLDGSAAMQALVDRGATGISHLHSLQALQNTQASLFDDL